MLLAASYAGIGFGNAGVHLPHAMAYPVAGNVEHYQPAGTRPITRWCRTGRRSSSIRPPSAARPHLQRRSATCRPRRPSARTFVTCGRTKRGEVLAKRVLHFMRLTDQPGGIRAFGYTRGGHSPAGRGHAGAGAAAEAVAGCANRRSVDATVPRLARRGQLTAHVGTALASAPRRVGHRRRTPAIAAVVGGGGRPVRQPHLRHSIPRAISVQETRASSGAINPPYTGTFVFDNDHPCVGEHAPRDWQPPPGIYRNRPGDGVARVVCYSPRHDLTLAQLDVDEVDALLETWQQQMRELAAHPDVAFVLIFENKGEVVGVSNPHPHCQIYATNFTFKNIETELQAGRRYLARPAGPCFRTSSRRSSRTGGASSAAWQRGSIRPVFRALCL